MPARVQRISCTDWLYCPVTTPRMRYPTMAISAVHLKFHILPHPLFWFVYKSTDDTSEPFLMHLFTFRRGTDLEMVLPVCMRDECYHIVGRLVEGPVSQLDSWLHIRLTAISIKAQYFKYLLTCRNGTTQPCLISMGTIYSPIVLASFRLQVTLHYMMVNLFDNYFYLYSVLCKPLFWMCQGSWFINTI